MADIAVAIPRFRRPHGLARLLAALERLETMHESKSSSPTMIATRGGIELCESLKADYRWPLKTMLVPERGIAQARNALVARILSRSDAQFIAMIDDDEWPEPHWLERFLAMQRETRADALHGTILRDFESPGRWAAFCPGIAPLRAQSGPTT